VNTTADGKGGGLRIDNFYEISSVMLKFDELMEKVQKLREDDKLTEAKAAVLEFKEKHISTFSENLDSEKIAYSLCALYFEVVSINEVEMNLTENYRLLLELGNMILKTQFDALSAIILA
jgi:hypothetical protein